MSSPTEEAVEQIAEAQGWNEVALLGLALEFIRDIGEGDAFVNRLRAIAADENAAGDEDDDPEEDLDADEGRDL